MRLFLFTLIFLPLLSLAQVRDSIYIKTTIFDVVYSEKLQQPKWIEYNVQCTEGTFSRKGLEFYSPKGITTSTNEDYENNVWDKGHLAPAADFNCSKETLKQTFNYLNCVLQHEKLNRGVWRQLEQHERDIAKNGVTTVEIRMVYSDKSIILPTGATVPDAFLKIIISNKICEKYFFKNEEPKYPNYQSYKINN
jgi:endonuclease G